MIKIQTITSFLGFGTKRGYYFSEGMHRTEEGIKPGWEIREATHSGALTDLLLIGWFSQVRIGVDNYIYGVNRSSVADGRIFRAFAGGNSFSLQRTPTTVSYGNGLITDQKGRLLYLQTRFLGMFDGTTWADSWRDFGVNIAPVDTFRPADLYEDWVAMGNGDKIALLNIKDDSFNSNAFNLPAGFVFRAIKSNRTGVLMGANFVNRSVLVLWNCQSSRSIAPWIWLDGEILSITTYGDLWKVAVGNKVILTNGYTIRELPELPDMGIHNFPLQNLFPSGLLSKDNYLFLNNGGGSGLGGTSGFGRDKKGLWILDLTTRLWEFCAVSNRCTQRVLLGAIIIDAQNNAYISYRTIRPARFYIGRIFQSFSAGSDTSNKAIYISPILGEGTNQKIAEALKINLNFVLKPEYAFVTPNPDIKIHTKIYDFKRKGINYIPTNAASTALNQLRVDGSSRSALAGQIEIGDEVSILEGANAGEVRHITSIANRRTATETWTLDSNLPNLTENEISLEVTPFKKIDIQTISSYEAKDYYFNIATSPQGRKFLIKIIMELGNPCLMPEMTELSFIYNDLGI